MEKPGKIQLTLYVDTNLLENPQALLYLPEFLATNTDTFALPINSTSRNANFVINVPQKSDKVPNIPNQVTISIQLLGTEINTGLPVSSELQQRVIQIQTSPRLVLNAEIKKPGSAAGQVGGTVSFGQNIRVKVWVEYDQQVSPKFANINSNGSIEVDSTILKEDGFTIAGDTKSNRQFTSLTDTLFWDILPPSSEKTVNLRFRFSEVPTDVNSGLPATIVQEPSFPIRVRQKEIIVMRRNNLLRNSDKAVTQGAENIPLLAFEVSNRDYADSLFVNGLRVGIYQPDDSRTPLSAQTIREMFSAIRVVNSQQYANTQSAQKITEDPEIFAEIQLDENSLNPFEVVFNKVLVIDSQAVDTIFVLADVSANAPRRAFYTTLDTVNVYDVSPDIGLALTDSLGNRYDAFAGFDEETNAVISSNPRENIGAYPNPFGRSSLGPQYERTVITIYTETASDISVRIFTLHGELVKTFNEQSAGRGLFRGIVWDGTNDKGKRVLNGVYICAIEVKPSGGGSTERYTLKIAYIK